jgi:hypothetical protein
MTCGYYVYPLLCYNVSFDKTLRTPSHESGNLIFNSFNNEMLIQAEHDVNRKPKLHTDMQYKGVTQPTMPSVHLPVTKFFFE